MRAAEHGFRSVLITDLGALVAFAELRHAGSLPSDMQAKVSVMAAIGNPATAKTWQDLGADTLNDTGDLGLGRLAAMRAAVAVPLDLYVESPDDLGGLVRLRDVADLIQVAAVYVKLGLRNAPALYPWGQHLGEGTAVAMGRASARSDRDGATRAGRHRHADIGARRRGPGGAVSVTPGPQTVTTETPASHGRARPSPDRPRHR